MVATCERRRWVWAAVLAALLLGTPQRALCQPEASKQPASPQAKAHFERGREHFRAGRYREAIVELKAALELDSKSPNLTYNVAYTNELLGDLAEAIVYYRRYLELLPDSAADERKKVEVTPSPHGLPAPRPRRRRRHPSRAHQAVPTPGSG
jgi:tetratricopeptide (TPR) repeat protein